MDQFRLAAHGDNEGLWDWNLVSNRVHFSPRWISMVGCDEHDVGCSPEEWFRRIHPEDAGQVRSEIDSRLTQGPCEFDIRHRLLHKDGAYRWMHCRGVVVRDETGRAVRLMGAHSDVSAEKIADAQTGLPNRLLFLDRLARSVEQGNRFETFHYAVLLLDLDRPEALRKPPESQAADPLLAAAARRLETCLRAGDSPSGNTRDYLAARLRGDEFAILLDGLTGVADAVVVADRVLAEMLAPFVEGGREVFLPASIGIAVSATGYARAEDVLRDADTALYRAKSLGRGRREIFDTAVLRSAQAALQMEADFKQALERGEFLLFYQPVVSLETNEISGFEALVRWQHPVRGMILPVEFIPIAEKTGFIVPLGNWILREACAQLGAWQQSLPVSKDLWVSVNLSSPQFNHAALVEQVRQAVRDAGLPAHGLVLELTESVAMENPAAVKSLLMQLRVMGVRVGLDDFGTGQSSLAYLHQFPADLLKLDRSFVRDMGTRADMRDIVSAVTALARQLGLHVIAEGIEDDEQLSLLRPLGCEYGQGFLFSRPVDSEGAAALLKTGLSGQQVHAPDGEPTPACQSERPLPARPERARRPADRRNVHVAAAALAVLLCAGLVGGFGLNPLSVVRSVSPAPVQIAGPLPPQPAAEQPPPPMAGSAAVRAETPVSPSTPNRAQATPKPQTYSLAVVHRHVVGSCRGLLVVSRRGVAFVPDGEKGKAEDAFTFKHGEFLYALSGESLTIKSHDKTYRFRASDATGPGSRSQLQKVVDSINRLRQAVPAT